MANNHEFLRKASTPKKGVLATEVASADSDPRFYTAMKILPNPDPVLRKMGRSQDVYQAIAYDAHVMGELRSQRGDLLKQEWRIQPGADDAASMQAFELCQAVFKRRPCRNMRWSDQIYNTFRSIYYGYSAAEIIWQKQGSHIVPCEIKDKPSRRFIFNHDHELRLLTKSNQMDGVEVPDYKFLLARHMPDYDNPYGVALFSACFWPYTFKHNGYRWFARFMERYGIPSPVGKYPAGTSKEGQQEMADDLLRLIEDAVAVIPEDGAVELLQVKSGGEKPHPTFINMCNRELSKALTSQTLASEVTEAGSRSTAGVQKERQDDNGEADREMVQANYQQLCDWVTELNFENATPPIWEFFDDEEVRKDVAETLEIVTRRAPVKRSEFYDRLQLTPPEEGDDVIFNGAAASDEDGGNQFSRAHHTHHFKSGHQDELSDLADQGVAASKKSINSMLSAIYDFAENEAETLDDLDDALPGLLDGVDKSDFENALKDSKVIAAAAGLDNAR